MPRKIGSETCQTTSKCYSFETCMPEVFSKACHTRFDSYCPKRDPLLRLIFFGTILQADGCQRKLRRREISLPAMGRVISYPYHPALKLKRREKLRRLWLHRVCREHPVIDCRADLSGLYCWLRCYAASDLTKWLRWLSKGTVPFG